jgi:hypothetical protein
LSCHREAEESASRQFHHYLNRNRKNPMAEIKEFIINDRRKFTAEGDVRPDAPPSEPKAPRPESLLGPEAESSARLVDTPVGNTPLVDTPIPHKLHPETEASSPDTQIDDASADENMPPAPTPEQMSQAATAFQATVTRLDTAIRATNPGMDPIPAMTFERVIQSIYMQALMQLGGAAAPGQQPQLDLLGARQTIDMLTILAEKTEGNLAPAESNLLHTALFELHMGFLEVTQAMARQAASRAPGFSNGPPNPTGGPSIVR